MNKNEILLLFNDWNNALKTKTAKNVVALYAQDALLLPTISNKVCRNHAEIEAYFTNFLIREPVGQINEANIKIFNDLAINSGIYTFSFHDKSSIQARFTFIYRWNGERWMIIKHHSSQMPEPMIT